jgi:hypothetical protein
VVREGDLLDLAMLQQMVGCRRALKPCPENQELHALLRRIARYG